MNVRELYDRMSLRIPEDLREPWDNDGIMVCPDENAEVENALVVLDVTEEVVDYAIERRFDLIVSHHPLIFHPVKQVTDSHPVARKLIKLLSNGISVFSFHTRADKVAGGVNDTLADILGLENVRPFGEGDLGRIGTLPEEVDPDNFALFVKERLDAFGILCADGYNPVRKVALVGGDGKDFLDAAISSGADTFLSGRIGYNLMEEAGERGINLIEAGHYFTEFPVTSFFSRLLTEIDPDLAVSIADSNAIRLY